MRRGFGRRRRQGPEEGQRSPIDASWIERVREACGFPAERFERVSFEDVPDGFALTARGEDADGQVWAVGIAPRSAADALLAGLVASARIEGASRVLAAAERADGTVRARLGAAGGLAEPPRVRILAADEGTELGGERRVPAPVAPERLAAQLERPADRAVFGRALDALRGLAAKHGGAVRGAGSDVELVILARRIALLRADAQGVALESLFPRRQVDRVSEASLAECLDRLEGFVRKRVNERRVRDGEEGLRGRALPALEDAAGLRFSLRWPIGGGDLDVIDAVGVGEDGVPVVAAVREHVTLPAFGEILDAALRVEPWLPTLLAGAEAPVRVGSPRIVLVAGEVDTSVEAALSRLTLTVARYEVDEGSGRPVLRAREGGTAAVPSPSRRAPRPERTPEPAPRERVDEDERPAAEARSGAERERRDEEERAGDGEPRRRSRRRSRSRGRGRRAPGAGASAGEGAEPEEAPAGETRFEELSLFDLDDDGAGGDDDGEGGSRRRRGRRRGRGRGRRNEEGRRTERSMGEGPDAAPDAGAGAEEPEGRRGRGRRRGGRGPAPGNDDEDLEDDIVPLVPDAPELDEATLPSYEEDEDDEPETEADRIRLEREKRRLARLAKAGPVEEAESESEEARSLPRGRAAILAAADRESIVAAALLARDWRQVEGIWIYPQEELMTFFRGVAIDLRENTPIFVIGFAAHPARDAIQAASLYRDRLAWFDHHEWPPEDLGAMADAIGADHLHVEPGAASALPAVVSFCTRRSRFSDKLVDLVTGRFTQHDFQRWGRVWWWRLGELTRKTGEHRADLESLLVGRPSDLAKEASRVPVPPLPEEHEYARSRDFRLVHFGGMAMVVLEVPEGLDVHLAGRIVRERYGAALSLARSAGSELCVLGADDAASKRALDVSGMVAHLDEKYAWVRAESDADHVARFRVQALEQEPERLDEVIAEIGMGRSILEG